MPWPLLLRSEPCPSPPGGAGIARGKIGGLDEWQSNVLWPASCRNRDFWEPSSEPPRTPIAVDVAASHTRQSAQLTVSEEEIKAGTCPSTHSLCQYSRGRLCCKVSLDASVTLVPRPSLTAGQ